MIPVPTHQIIHMCAYLTMKGWFCDSLQMWWKPGRAGGSLDLWAAYRAEAP